MAASGVTTKNLDGLLEGDHEVHPKVGVFAR